ncbi:MAG TPA: phospholipase C, phosphocholine-specific [Trebonia sp.]|nr:phospholipase C, phosphocholine-specific [Trebonia sp.]
MPELSRRNVLRGAAATGAAAAASAATLSGAPSALAATPASAAKGSAAKSGAKPHGDIRDIKHVVILMQENRSFDHYFGSLKGVIGFGDRSAISTPGGYSVFQQPTSAPGTAVAGTQYPWPLAGGSFAGAQPPTPEQGAQNYGGTDHSWGTQHGAWWGGHLSGWYAYKGGPATLGFLDRDDIPFHYALADAYTIGDAYHCSVLSATGPNRTYLWSGTVNADQEHGSYIANNGGDELGQFLPWESYPETLQNAGVTWKIYQGSDNYGDNGAQYFKTLADLDPSQGGTAPAPGTNVYYDNGLAVVPEPLDPEQFNGDNLASAILADVQAGTLPQVSWVVTNQQYSEHPDGAPTDGAYYVGKVLQALATDEDLFNSTLVIIDFDENDGQFDHVPPPVAPQGTKDEFVLDTTVAPVPLPVGLGYRVPLILISPWTRGGFVFSEVSDHTSVIQFLERWTTAIGRPARCPNISAWRRSVCGDLTAAFNFKKPVYGLPALPFITATVGEAHSYHPVPNSNARPAQEAGTKPAKALPVQPNASLAGVAASAGGGVTVSLGLQNYSAHARRASHFMVYDNTLAVAPAIGAYPAAFPGAYTVAPSAKAATTTVTQEVSGPAYDVTVVSANRFLRRFAGDMTKAGAELQVTASYYEGNGSSTDKPLIFFDLCNSTGKPVTFTLAYTSYTKAPADKISCDAHGRWSHQVDDLVTTHGWYDITVTADIDPTWSQRFIGHIENGADSVTGSF